MFLHILCLDFAFHEQDVVHHTKMWNKRETGTEEAVREGAREAEACGCSTGGEWKWHEHYCNMRSFKTHPMTHRGCIEHLRRSVTIQDFRAESRCHARQEEVEEGGGRRSSTKTSWWILKKKASTCWIIFHREAPQRHSSPKQSSSKQSQMSASETIAGTLRCTFRAAGGLNESSLQLICIVKWPFVVSGFFVVVVVFFHSWHPPASIWFLTKAGRFSAY